MKAMQMQGHPKLRIKIPRMQRKFHLHVKDKANANDRDNRSIKAKPGNQFPRTSSSVLGNKRSLGILKKNERNGKELGNNLARGVEPVPVVAAALSQLLTLEPDRAREGKQNRKDKRRAKMNVHLLSFLNKKKGWNNFIRAKLRAVRFSGDGDGVVRQVIRRKVSSWRLVRNRIPSKIVVIRPKLKMIRSLMKRRVTKQFGQGAADDENGDEDNDRELCKKRILMGGRCKPLSSSGTLSYDTDGLFLPEILP